MNITVYCGANLGTETAYTQASIQLANWITDNHHSLVYGGGKTGLMGVVADRVLQNQGTVTGIIPHFLADRELAHEGLSELIFVETMSERKLKMIDLGDCYIALAGGTGTLEEIAEVISWTKIGQNNNPCIIFNTNGFYDNLKKFFDDMVSNGFLDADYNDRVLFTDSLDEMEQFIASYTVPCIRQYDE